nr:hypothetical protein KPHV_29700 [Kitasatospora purpeofusca]
MPRRLAHAVHLEHPGTCERLVLLPGEEVPPELAELITHTDAWAADNSDEDPAEPESDPEPDDDTQQPKPARTRKARTDTD